MESPYLNHIEMMLIVSRAVHNLPSKCSYCGKDYKEHEDFEGIYQGVFDEDGKIACCRGCFEKYEWAVEDQP